MSLKLKLVQQVNRILRSLSIRGHRMEMQLAWSSSNQPTYFNHFYDLYYQWPGALLYSWVERGVFNAFFIREGNQVLELACGDGFNTKHFFSKKAKHILALDYDQSALQHARQSNSMGNIEYLHCDLTVDFPNGSFDNVIMDAAIEQFTEQQQRDLFEKIRSSLKDGGVFSGLSIARNPDKDHLIHNKHEYNTALELKKMLNSVFDHCSVFENEHQEKGHLYFIASNQPINFRAI